MLMPVVLFMFMVLVAGRRVKGPLWALAIAWLVCLLPITTGLIDFADLTDPSFAFSEVLIAYNAAFVGGITLFYAVRRDQPRTNAVGAPTRGTLQLVWICWVVGLAGAGCMLIDFLVYGGGGLSDLQALRDTIVARNAASPLAQLGSVLTWGCLFCYVFVLVYRTRIGRYRSAILIAPIFGYFLLSLLSAGRQAAFQVMLFAAVTAALVAARRPTGAATAEFRRPGLLLPAISAAMIGYMGLVAVFRNDNSISDDKSDVLAALFNFKLSPTIVGIGNLFGPSVRSVAVEAITYFSSSISIFERFLTLHFPPSYGAMSVPLVFRQFQSVSGIVPADVLSNRVDALNDAGVIGAGWTTAFGNYLMDFGPLGTVAVLLVSGFYTAFAWDRGLRSNHFEEIVVAVLVMVGVIYLPIFPAESDTNLLLLWFFCLGVSWLRHRHPGFTPSLSRI